MMSEVTMVLTVNSKCCKCYKKVKKVLCGIPEVKDQVYDEKQSKVTIKVVSCCPEKIRQKIRCKGCKSIESIAIVKPPDDKPKEEGNETKKEGDKPPAEKKPPKPDDHKPKQILVCCRECSEGRGGGPCEQSGYGRPPCYCIPPYYGRPVCGGWVGGCNCGCNRGYHYILCEESPSGCAIM